MRRIERRPRGGLHFCTASVLLVTKCTIFGSISLCSAITGCAIDDRAARVLEQDPNTSGSAGAAGNGVTGAVGATGTGGTGSAGAAPTGGSPGQMATAGGASGQGSESGGSPGVAGAGGQGGTAPVTPPVQETIGGCFNQLLANGGFESDGSGWTEIAELRDVVVERNDPALLQAGVTPQAGDYLAWIGGIPNNQFDGYATTLQQEVAIPAEALSLTFSGYAWVVQPEPGQMPFDWAVLELSDPDPNSSFIWLVRLWNDEALTSGWTYFEVTLSEEVFRLAGKTAPLNLDSRPNGGGTLSVWLDSLRLEARCPQ